MRNRDSEISSTSQKRKTRQAPVRNRDYAILSTSQTRKTRQLQCVIVIIRHYRRRKHGKNVKLQWVIRDYEIFSKSQIRKTRQGPVRNRDYEIIHVTKTETRQAPLLNCSENIDLSGAIEPAKNT